MKRRHNQNNFCSSKAEVNCAAFPIHEEIINVLPLVQAVLMILPLHIPNSLLESYYPRIGNQALLPCFQDGNSPQILSEMHSLIRLRNVLFSYVLLLASTNSTIVQNCKGQLRHFRRNIHLSCFHTPNHQYTFKPVYIEIYRLLTFIQLQLFIVMLL